MLARALLVFLLTVSTATAQPSLGGLTLRAKGERFVDEQLDFCPDGRVMVFRGWGSGGYVDEFRWELTGEKLRITRFDGRHFETLTILAWTKATMKARTEERRTVTYSLFPRTRRLTRRCN